MTDRTDMPLMADEETLWRAVEARDRAWDGRFVFAVETTGVYCRPGCPARRPRRENVTFHAGPREAEVAGYRPCRRCAPDADRGAGPVDAARRILDAADEPPALADLAARVGRSPWHLLRAFKAETGLTPREYAAARRRERLKGALRGGHSVMEATFEAGYGSSSRAYEEANGFLGMTPATYGAGGKGAAIAYALTDSPVGRLLVAGTERGLCFLAIGEEDAGLEAALRVEYPRAEIREDHGAVAPWRDAVLEHMARRRPLLALPLDVRATEFQRRVWQSLCAIPAGETRTYKEIAAELGAPGAVRAVGTACGANPVALVIPCHRAIGSDGRLHGYRWGLERKQKLLDLERQET